MCQIQLGKMLSPASKTGHRPRSYLRNANVQWNRFDLSNVAWMDFSEADEAKFALRSGDVLICEGGEPGRAAVWDGQLDPCYYQKALHRLRPIRDAVDPHFIVFRLWLGAQVGEFTASNAKTTIAHLPAVRLAELPLAIPPLAEQVRIVGILRDQMAAVERTRAAAAAQVEAARALPAAYLRGAFRGITPLATDGIRDAAPPGWSWRPLTDLARLESGHTPSRNHPEWWGGDVPWIALPDIRALDGCVAMETSEYTNEAGIANSSARVLPAGTVVLSRTASVGFVTIMGRPMATSQDFVNWVCGPDLSPEYLAFLLRASRRYIRELASGAVHKTVYVPTVKALQVCMPPRAEQEQIVRGLGAQLRIVEKTRLALERQLDEIDRLPAAVLRRVFSGGL